MREIEIKSTKNGDCIIILKGKSKSFLRVTREERKKLTALLEDFYFIDYLDEQREKGLKNNARK